MNLIHQNQQSNINKPHRLVFLAMDKAPPSPENFKAPEKQSEAVQVREVAAKTPSDIYNDATSAGSGVSARYTNNTQLLANLAHDDLMGGTGSSTTGDDDDTTTNGPSANDPSSQDGTTQTIA